MTTIMARINFHGDDADDGIAALRARGYAVLTHVFPDEPNYLFVEATREINSGDDGDSASCQVLDEVRAIADGLYGFVADAGPPPAGHVPFHYDAPAWSASLN